MTIPGIFRIRWTNFFQSVLPQFMGYDSYTLATPIVKAFIDFSRLALAFGLVWLIGWAITKIFKEIFG